MAHRIVYRPSARRDLADIYDWVSSRADGPTAIAYLERIREACERLASFPNRGTPQDDLSPGIRTISFERRAVIAYLGAPGTVRIVRVLHGGRDLTRALKRTT